VPYRFFYVPVHFSEWAEEELNAFLHSHRVLRVERRFVEAGENSYWSFCVDYAEGGERRGPARQQAGKSKVDYREVLSPEEFEVYAKLRELRKEIAGEESVPVYMVFTNEQLAEMVRRKVASKEGLEKIEGVGPARVDKYGAKMLELLTRSAGSKSNETGQKSV